MKNIIKMRNISHGYDINRLRSRHGHRYTKYKKCHRMMVLIYIKQHVRNIGALFHEKVLQQ